MSTTAPMTKFGAAEDTTLAGLADRLREVWPTAAQLIIVAEADSSGPRIEAVATAQGHYLGSYDDPENPAGADQVLETLFWANTLADLAANTATNSANQRGLSAHETRQIVSF